MAISVVIILCLEGAKGNGETGHRQEKRAPVCAPQRTGALSMQH